MSTEYLLLHEYLLFEISEAKKISTYLTGFKFSSGGNMEPKMGGMGTTASKGGGPACLESQVPPAMISCSESCGGKGAEGLC